MEQEKRYVVFKRGKDGNRYVSLDRGGGLQLRWKILSVTTPEEIEDFNTAEVKETHELK